MNRYFFLILFYYSIIPWDKRAIMVLTLDFTRIEAIYWLSYSPPSVPYSLVIMMGQHQTQSVVLDPFDKLHPVHLVVHFIQLGLALLQFATRTPLHLGVLTVLYPVQHRLGLHYLWRYVMIGIINYDNYRREMMVKHILGLTHTHTSTIWLCRVILHNS